MLAVTSRHAYDAVSHPYACIVPSWHASNAAHHPYACSSLPTCLQCPPHTSLILTLLQPPEGETTMAPPISALATPSCSSLPLTILTLPWLPQDIPLMPPSTPLMPNPLSTTYHPYPQVLYP
ncbi:hypothetical protein O181_045513 [Austropuccinia psidii MF-1]|uniref:Uncharacterized protein n=1 Tax=Austropuccinia psidii MF-1 TaxID=1389203 RepID=A0A9Q3DS74_9BASI|nr:hypothetical protein [Austropuccinia psidii MF-1]